MQSRLLLPLLLLLQPCALRLAAAWRADGVLPMGAEYKYYVGKFCFDFKREPPIDAGLFQVELSGHVLAGPNDGPPCFGKCPTQGKFFLFVYDDESEHWQVARKNWDQLTCEEMARDASYTADLSDLDGTKTLAVRVREKIRPRFWYFTFAACGVTFEQQVSYQMHMENPLLGLQSEFGIDEKGSLQLQLLSMMLFVSISLALRKVQQDSSGAEALRTRPLLRILQFSALCSAAGASCLALHYAVFAFDGRGLTLTLMLGQIWVIASKALLSLLQLLTAKGWALFYAPEELQQRRIMGCMLASIICLSVSCEIHADFFHDWSTTLYLYESWPGTIILLLNIVLFAETWRSMRDTYRHEHSDEVRVFYAVISLASILYFLALPVLTLLAPMFAPYTRGKYCDRGETASRFLATLLLFFCLRPSRLDAMVNARLEEGLDTVGEPVDDDEAVDRGIIEKADGDFGAEPLLRGEDDRSGYREASEDVAEDLARMTGTAHDGPVE